MSKKVSLDYSSPHSKNAKKFRLKEYLLLGAGPTNVSDRVMKALGMQILNPTTSDMFNLMDEVKAMLQYIFQTKNKFTIVQQTSGNGANEAVLLNILEPGDNLVIAIGGTWGEKVLDMAKRYGLNVLALRKPAGEVFTIEELTSAVVSHKAKLLFVTHGESTGSTLQPLEGIGPMCHKHNCLLAVDAVVSLGVDPLFTDRWEVDIVTSATQKAIGAPPGMSLLTFSPRAEKCMKERKHPTPYYFDLLRQGVYFNCFDDIKTKEYHYTFSSSMLAAIREAMATICEEGLPEMWERHKRNTELFWTKLEEIGLEIFVKKRENRFSGVTCVNVPEGVDQMEFIRYIKEKHDIEIMPGHGPTLNKAVRIGFLGDNSRPEVVEYLSEALRDGVRHFKKKSSYANGSNGQLKD